MNDETIKRAHWSFWLISVLALLWNLGGAINYLMQTNIEFVVSLPETHKAIIKSRPFWATGGFAIGVFGGAIGCLLLLLRKSLAFYVLIASLIGVIVTMFHTINIANSKITFSLSEIVVMIILPVVVSAIMVWYAKLVSKKYWTS